MTKFIEHLNSNIIEIVSNNIQNNENDFEASFQNSLNDISSFMQKLGINNNIIDEVSVSIKDKFNDLLQKGLSPEEAYNESFQSVYNILSSSISDESSIGFFKDEENKYDLNYASSSSNDKSLLIDDAMAKGMSVEEAVRYVNSQFNPSGNEEFGPPNLVDTHNMNSNDELLAKSDDEINLDKIEADMDEEANKISRDNSVNTEKSSTKEILVDTYNDKLEDDDMS